MTSEPFLEVTFATGNVSITGQKAYLYGSIGLYIDLYWVQKHSYVDKEGSTFGQHGVQKHCYVGQEGSTYGPDYLNGGKEQEFSTTKGDACTLKMMLKVEQIPPKHTLKRCR